MSQSIEGTTELTIKMENGETRTFQVDYGIYANELTIHAAIDVETDEEFFGSYQDGATLRSEVMEFLEGQKAAQSEASAGIF